MYLRAPKSRGRSVTTVVGSRGTLLRICPAPNCGIVFEPAVWNQRYHAPSCKKRVENAKARGIDPAETYPPVPFECAECGRRCVPGEDGVDPKARRFCGLAHKRSFHRLERERAEGEAA